jgi:hypothetical protein
MPQTRVVGRQPYVKKHIFIFFFEKYFFHQKNDYLAGVIFCLK